MKLRADASKGAAEKSGMGETLQIGTYFALWYLFNIAYNIYNKQALNVLSYPWTIATLQMATGVFYFVPMWLLKLRKAPKLSVSDLKTLFPIALCHTGVHVGAVIALGAGAVSFAHIVKASEPVVTCLMNYLFLGQVLPLPVYLTLLPIIGGVAIASMKELSFTVLALASAMLSNVSSSARGVLSKKTMSGKAIGENLDAQNLYAVLTAMSTCVLIPLMLAIEGTAFFGAFKNTVAAGDFTNKSLAALLALVVGVVRSSTKGHDAMMLTGDWKWGWIYSVLITLQSSKLCLFEILTTNPLQNWKMRKHHHINLLPQCWVVGRWINKRVVYFCSRCLL